MNYCSHCGSSVTKIIPDGDSRLRSVCSSCDTIHYSNPRMIVGVLPSYQDKVLLCKRAIEPRKGFWTIPAGFMENGESTMAGAIRETWEEALAKVVEPSLYRVFDLPSINQVYIIYRAQLADLEYGPGEESLEVELFSEVEVPWDQLAFPIVTESLLAYFADCEQNKFGVEVQEIASLIKKRG